MLLTNKGNSCGNMRQYAWKNRIIKYVSERKEVLLVLVELDDSFVTT
jgi:hypothetical protein